MRDSSYVLDGLLYHRSDLRIAEIVRRGRLFLPQGDAACDALIPTICSDSLNFEQVRTHWDPILRLAASNVQDTATASLMLGEPGSYGCRVLQPAGRASI